VSDSRKIPGLTLFGKPVTDDTIYVFPGPLQFGTSNSNLTVKDSNGDKYFSTAPGDFTGPYLTVDLSSTGKKAALDAVSAKVQECAKARSLEPVGCPQRMFDFDVVAGTTTWRITSNLQSVLKADNLSPSTPLTISVSGNVKWSVRYKVDFGDRAFYKSDTTTSFVNGTVDLSKSPPTVKTS